MFARVASYEIDLEHFGPVADVHKLDQRGAISKHGPALQPANP